MTGASESDPRRRRAAPTPLAAALLALACAGDSAPPPPSEQPPDGVHGQAPPAVGGVPSVVTLEPVDGAAGAAADAPAGAADAPVLDQFGLAFSPRAMVVRAGEPFTVTNSEQLAHNVTIRSGETDSTVVNADTDPNERFDLTLDRPGPYHVTCNVHPGMAAFIFATTARYAAVAEADGAFVVEDVPPGSYTMTVWSADASRVGSREVEVQGRSTEVTFQPGG